MSTLKTNNLSSVTAVDLNFQINGVTKGTLENSTGLFDQIKVIQQSAQLIATTASTASTFPIDDTIPQNTEGAEFTTLSFTPLTSTSTLEISFTCSITASATVNAIVAIFQDSTADALFARYKYIAGSNEMNEISGVFQVSSASTSSRTYKIRYGANTGTTYINQATSGRIFGGVVLSGLTIKELV